MSPTVLRVLAGTAPAGHRSGQGHGTFVILTIQRILGCQYYQAFRDSSLLHNAVVLHSINKSIFILDTFYTL
jgi:hypothetical protein